MGNIFLFFLYFSDKLDNQGQYFVELSLPQNTNFQDLDSGLAF